MYLSKVSLIRWWVNNNAIPVYWCIKILGDNMISKYGWLHRLVERRKMNEMSFEAYIFFSYIYWTNISQNIISIEENIELKFYFWKVSLSSLFKLCLKCRSTCILSLVPKLMADKILVRILMDKNSIIIELVNSNDDYYYNWKIITMH